MKANLKVILSTVGVAAFLASPAVAKTARHQHAVQPTVSVPSNARGSVATYGTSEGGPYTPSKPAPRSKNYDFQDSPR